ncbi:MAG TPA: tetratricopeptide repeat protein [bacterium]|nr:tetratricopeptide repeat protein [bacterium]HPN45395.1 tetratricopeptide repeat protein [bacterium]
MIYSTKTFLKRYCQFFSPVVLLALLAGCNLESDRRIKLASQPVTVLMQDKVSTIQVAAAQKKSLAIFQFLNKTGMNSLDWLESGIVEMLGGELAQSRQLNLKSTSRITETMQELGYNRQLLADSLAGSAVAQQIGAEVFICGSYLIKNDSLRIDLELRDARNGFLLKRVSETGGGLENVFAMVNRLSRKLREHFQINSSNTPEINKNLANVTTSSVEAYKYYAQGVELESKLYLDQAAVEFKKAVGIDSTFASAWHHLGVIQGANGNNREAVELLDKAVHYSESSPPKERLKILASHAIMTGSLYEAIEIYKQLTNMFPEDDNAHFNLGNYYFMQNNSWDKAIEEFEITIALNPKNKLAYNHLGYACAATGKLDYAWHYLQKYIELAPDEPNPYDSYGEVLQKQGQLDEAIAQYKKALDINPEFYPAIVHLVNVNLDKGKIGKARSIANKALKKADTPNEKFTASHLLARTYFTAGNIGKSIQILEKLYRENPDKLYTLYVLMLLDHDPALNKQRLNNWFENTPNIADSLQINYNNLFLVVSLCLQYDYCLDKAEQYLNQFLASKSDPFLLQTAVAYKQLIYFLGKSQDSSPVEMPDELYDSNVFSETNNIAWLYYWKYYFKALEQAQKQKEIAPGDIQAIIDYSRQENNLHFEINSSYALAFLHLLDNNHRAFTDIFRFTGAPLESEWRFWGPFAVKKGLHEQYWPEQLPVIDLLNKTKDLSTVTDVKAAVTDGYINLQQITQAGPNNTVFGLLAVNVPSARIAQIRLGPAGPVKMWLNGHLILTRNEYEPALLDRIITSVNLNTGMNYILVKCYNRIGDMGFYFRLTDEKGYGFPDITFSPAAQTLACSVH